MLKFNFLISSIFLNIRFKYGSQFRTQKQRAIFIKYNINIFIFIYLYLYINIFIQQNVITKI